MVGEGRPVYLDRSLSKMLQPFHLCDLSNDLPADFDTNSLGNGSSHFPCHTVTHLLASTVRPGHLVWIWTGQVIAIDGAKQGSNSFLSKSPGGPLQPPEPLHFGFFPPNADLFPSLTLLVCQQKVSWLLPTPITYKRFAL